MRRFFYLTNNEFYSGIYQGQVIDMVSYLRVNQNMDIRLVAFLPLKKYMEGRALIKRHMPNAIVLPSAPRQSRGLRWKHNRYLLYLFCLLYRRKGIVSRNPIATNLALLVKSMGAIDLVCYDGRGAVAAESVEYGIYSTGIKREIVALERGAVERSDFRMCITNNLLEYWRTQYNYSGTNYFIIPGTLSRNFSSFVLSDDEVEHLRTQMGYSAKDVLLIYSGSTGVWQSFDILFDFLVGQLEGNEYVKVLFLSRSDSYIDRLASLYPQRVRRIWTTPEKVSEMLWVADYGLIIRGDSVTNKVSLPTKFPEYLACGLSILVNWSVEEVSRFVAKHSCGDIIDSGELICLKRNNFRNRMRNRELALSGYDKYSKGISMRYKTLAIHLDT